MLGTVFEFAPAWDGITYMTPDPFYFMDFPTGGICWQTYVYMICEYIVIMIFVGIIATEAKEYRLAIWVFFWLVFADLIDYLLTYNSIWFYAGIPISMNVLKCFIFGITIFYEWTKDYKLYR